MRLLDCITGGSTPRNCYDSLQYYSANVKGPFVGHLRTQDVISFLSSVAFFCNF